MRIVILFFSLSLFLFLFIACKKSNRAADTSSSNDNQIMEDKFHYEVSCSASKAAIAYVHKADFIGESGALTGTFGNPYHGAGMACGSSPVADYESTRYYLPKAIDAIWISLVDRKAYSLQALLPYEKMVSIFKECKMEELDLCFLPGGKVLLFLKGNGNCLILDEIPNGVEYNDDVELSRVYKCYGFHNMEEYYDHIYEVSAKAQEPWISYMKKNGSPVKLLDRYLQIFNYKINFVFEDDATNYLKFSSWFTNAVHCSSSSGIKDSLIKKSRIKEIKAMWDTDEFRYTSWMYFNEEELLRVFDEAYGEDRMQNGELTIKVNKENNQFEISLNVGDKSIKLEKTEIDVFSDPIENPYGDGTLVYDNYDERRNYFLDDKEYYQE